MIEPLSLNTLPNEIASLPVLALLATWFGAGLVDPFRGFLAALTVLPLLLLTSARGRWAALAVFFLPTTILASLLAGIWFAETGVVDDSRVVIDEAAGVCVAAIGGWRSWRWTLAVPPVFGLVDRIKPWPVSELELIRPADLGVLIDDCGAGLLAALGMLVLRLVWRRKWRPD